MPLPSGALRPASFLCTVADVTTEAILYHFHSGFRLSTANAASLKNVAYARHRIFAWTAAVDEALKVASRRSYFPVRLRSRRA